MICPRCAATVAINARFCGECGAVMPTRCGSCGNENPPSNRFCGKCGADLTLGSVTVREPASDRRQLTVMFADMVDSTALGIRLDPEELRHVIFAFHGCITGLVARSGGFVGRYMGDGVLIYFGYPHAHEDDGERAVRTGLAIVEAVSRLNTIAGPPGTLKVRVGISTGLVVVGDIIGLGAALESSVVGDTPNLAARLQTMAEPNMVVIADSTKRLTRGLFEYKGLGPTRLKGRDELVRAWVVLGESGIESRFEALHPSQVPLVGRLEEIELLHRRWKQAVTGRGRVVLVSGEAGIGKSRLIAALEETIELAECIRLRFLCSPHYQDTPLYPFVRHLERAAAFQRSDSPETRLVKLRNLLARTTSSEADISLFADLLSIALPNRSPSEILTPKRTKEMIFSAIVRQIEVLATQTPVFVVLEDIHWSDPTTLDLLHLLIEAIEQLPILLVVTARTEVRPSWLVRPHVTLQLLNGLDRREAAALMKEISGEAELSEEVASRIIAHADGVPLFIEELTKTVLENSFRSNNNGQLSEIEPMSVDEIPNSLHASLMARLDRLSTGKEVAQVGAVIGREFSFEALQVLTSRPPKELENALEELARADLIIARGRPPNATCIFRHALLQDAAYASLLRERRRSLHLRLAEAMEKEAIGSITPAPQLLAWHFAEAGAPDKSIDYYLKAVARASGRFAIAEMVSYLRGGLRQLKHLPASPETLRRELDMQIALGRVLIDHLGSGSEEVRVAYERARELCLTLHEPKQLLRVHDGLAIYQFTRSELNSMIDYASEMLEIGRKTGDPQAFLMAYRSRGFGYLLLGKLDKARNELGLLVDTYEAERDGPHAGLTPRDPKVSGCTALGICLTAMGYPSSGKKVSMQGVKHAESLNHPASLILGLRRACVQCMLQRDSYGAIELSERLLRMTTEYETFKGVRDGTIFHCWAHLQAHRDPALLNRMLTCIAQLDSTNHLAMLPFFLASAAELSGDHGDSRSAITLLERASELCKLTGEQWCAPEIMRLRARFCARDLDEATTLLQNSRALAGEQGAKLWELRTGNQLARLFIDQGRPAMARATVIPIYEWFTNDFEAADLVEARALLDELAKFVC